MRDPHIKLSSNQTSAASLHKTANLKNANFSRHLVGLDFLNSHQEEDSSVAKIMSQIYKQSSYANVKNSPRKSTKNSSRKSPGPNFTLPA